MIDKIKIILKENPNLTAKEIAKVLGCTRKEVNQFFHYNPDGFIKDEITSTWKLGSTDELIISFAQRWITGPLFEESLNKSVFDISNIKSVVFVLPKDCKFFVEASARLLAFCNQLVINKKNVSIDLSNNSSSLHYLNRAGFFDQLNEDVTVLPRRPQQSTARSLKGNSKRVVEFGSVDPSKENGELIKQLTDSFVSFTSEDYENPLFTIFAEMIKNIKDHSGSKLKGFAGLQKYDGYSGKKPHIQVVVSDSGVGIAATLRPHLKTHYPAFQKISDLELVKMVLQGKQLSKHGSDADSGHGMGFKISHDKALKYNANYSIRQSDFSLEFEFKNGKLLPPKEIMELVPILGTHICFDFIIDASVAD